MASIKVETGDGALSIEEAHKLLKIASKAIGNDFFAAMAKALSDLLGVRWVLVSMLNRGDSTKASTLLVWENGRVVENFDYELRGSPCENILTQGACAYASNLQQQFASDDLLSEMGAHSYVGMPVSSSSKKVFGLVAVLHDGPISNTRLALEALELFAGRVGSEMERLATTTSVERLGQIVEESLSEAFVFSADTYKFGLVNRGARQNLGFSSEELRSLTPWDIKPEFSEEQFRKTVAPLLSGKIPSLQFDTVHERKDGSLYNVAVQLQYFPKPDHVFFASITDTTLQCAAAEREKILTKEVNHRSKNLLALVQVIARNTAADHPQDYVAVFNQRILALAANQDLLVQNHWSRIPIEDLLRSQLAFLSELFGKRISLDGPRLELGSTAAQALGMAVHELATNASKYGALSNDAGTVAISWSLQDTLGMEKFMFAWEENHGPPVSPPARKGLGTTILQRQMAGLLDAEVAIDFRGTGLAYRVTAPVEKVIDRGYAEPKLSV